MKRALYKTSIFIPLSMIFCFFIDPITFCICEIDLYLDSMTSIFLIVMITVIWLCCSPFRKTCCNGTWSELLFNLIPIELVLMLNFAQWHFVAFAVITSILIGTEIALFIRLRKKKHERRVTKKRHWVYKCMFHRSSVLITAIFSTIPCLVSIFIYGLQPPTYQAQKEIENQLFLEITQDQTSIITEDDPYQENMGLWNCFESDKWSRYSISEKITIIQKLVDFESNVLGVPTIPVTSGLIGKFTLGLYKEESNEIWINTEHLAKSSARECIQTICHEIWHSLQYYLINNLDWKNPALQTSYFTELHGWLENQKNYKNAWDSDFHEYEDQPLETSARTYAMEESSKIMSYVRD